MKSWVAGIKNSFRYLKLPNIVALLSLLGIQLFLVISIIVFAPIFLSVAASILFIAFLIVMLYTQVALSKLSYSESVQRWELTSVLNNLSDAVIIYDPVFTILTVNSAAEYFFKIRSSEVYGKIIDPQSVHDPQLSLLAQVMFPTLAPRVSHLSNPDSWPQVVSVTLENPRMELIATLHRILDSQNQVIGFLKIVRDRTREVEILETKNEFISTAAHQLRTPLSGVRWALESLNSGEAKKLSADSQVIVSEALKLAERSLKITNDLLDAAKIEEGKFGYELEETNLVEIVKGIIEEAAPLAREMGVSIIFTPPEKKVNVFADASRIAMAVTNLLDNSIKYNVRGGKVTIRIELAIKEPFVKVVFEDTGVGVPQDEVEKLFHKLHRGSNVLSLEPNGSGLGLYIAKNIIERHGGSVGVNSMVNRGSLFWFTLPTDPSRVPQQRGVKTD